MAITVRKNSDDRMLNANIANVPGFVQQRSDGDSEMQRISLKQWRIRVRCSTMNDHTVEINRRTQAGQMESKALHLHLAAQCFAGFLLRRFQKIVVEPLAVHENEQPQKDQQSQNVKTGKDPGCNFPPSFASFFRVCRS